MCIGTINTGNAVDERYFVGKIYSFKIWDNENLVRDYIPVTNTIINKAGLYDSVEKKFYPNLGSGNFTAGSAKNNNN